MVKVISWNVGLINEINIIFCPFVLLKKKTRDFRLVLDSNWQIIEIYSAYSNVSM